MSALPDKPASFHALHAVYHERDFVVRVNDPTINFVRRILSEETLGQRGIADLKTGCPACAAGYDFSALQPNNEDRRGR